MAVLVLWRKNL